MSNASQTLVAYGPAHVAALAVIAAVAVVVVAKVWAPRRAARGVCRALAAVLLVNVIFEQCYTAATGRWSLAESLPLHLCDLSVFAAIVALVLATRRRAPQSVGNVLSVQDDSRETTTGHDCPGGMGKYSCPCGQEPDSPRASVLAHATQSGGCAWFDVVYYWGLAGATQALLTPSVGQGFPGPLFFTYFTAHGSVVVAVLVLMFGLRLRPRRGSGVRVWLLTNVVAVPVLACDRLVGANYMYLRGPAEAPSVLDYLGDWPWPFLLSLNLLVAVCIALCYAPWWWVDRRRRT